MTRSRSKLADKLDALVDEGRVALTETRDAVTIHQLEGIEAKQVLSLIANLDWHIGSITDDGGALAPEKIEDDDVGITIRVQKPNVSAEVEAILTRTGLSAALNRADLGGQLWVNGLNKAFQTLSVHFAPWDDNSEFSAIEVPASPRRLVRILDNGSRFPDDLGRWLLRSPETEISGAGIEPWRRMAVERLAQSLADEIEPDGKLLFRGPPLIRFTPDAGSFVEAGALQAVQRAALWVFDNPREAENKHLLMAAEVARTALAGGNACDLATVTAHAFEGARIAYSFGVTQQSRDTLKALSDLRKAVTDETGKLAETTRGLSAAITGSVVANLGIVVARLAIPNNANWVPGAAIAIAFVLALYVGSTIWNGAHFLGLQAKLRTQWRDRLYRFLDDGDYTKMVTDPVSKAERAFWTTAVIGGVMTLILFCAVARIAASA